MILIRFAFLTDEKLLDAYQKAIELQLSSQFIQILEEELQKRNLKQHTSTFNIKVDFGAVEQ
ncbi:hypothetical protein GCM10008986_05990 [Salinibacillus aidingensis]|uniref:Sporulation inhibitor A n=1 Tax=Salinibacillus aidingensis TaxID=237684 RepID=A0ABN1ATU7_9BACI